MSRDGWMKKKANAGGDNGWAERVSVCHLITSRSSINVWQESCQCEDMPTVKRIVSLMTEGEV